MSCFSFFPNLIYLPGHILDKKGIGAILKQKDTNSKLAQNWMLFSRFQGQRVQLLQSRICPAYIFIVNCLSTIYSTCFQGPFWQK